MALFHGGRSAGLAAIVLQNRLQLEHQLGLQLSEVDDGLADRVVDAQKIADVAALRHRLLNLLALGVENVGDAGFLQGDGAQQLVLHAAVILLAAGRARGNWRMRRTGWRTGRRTGWRTGWRTGRRAGWRTGCRTGRRTRCRTAAVAAEATGHQKGFARAEVGEE